MKLLDDQLFDINWLKGALVTNEVGASFYIKDVKVNLVEHQVYVQLNDDSCIPWDTLKSWGIQFQ